MAPTPERAHHERDYDPPIHDTAIRLAATEVCMLFVDNRHGSGRFSPLVGRDGAVAPHTQGRARTRSRLYRRILQPEARRISSERTDVVSRIVIADPTAQFHFVPDDELSESELSKFHAKKIVRIRTTRGWLIPSDTDSDVPP
jgi:hypothetical protein